MARPLKVLYLTPPARRGGALAAQSFVEEEIRAIAGHGVSAYVLTDEVTAGVEMSGARLTGLSRGRLTALPATAAFAIRHVPFVARVLRASLRPRHLAHVLRIEHAAARLIVREGIDLVHSHFGWPAGFGGSLAARATGRPLVASIRGMDVLVRPEIGYGLRRDPAYDVALRHLLDTASIVLTATTFMSGETLALGAPPEKVKVLEKGVDLATFRAPADRDAAKQRLGVTGPLLLAVGSLKRRKGFDVIIDAVAAVASERPGITLAICGDGEERSALEDRAAARGIAANVRLVGHVPRARIPEYFSAADIFMHAAELEAAGNVVLEALAAECGVVVTDSGGPSEYVEDGVNGFVVPVGNAPALASRVETMIDNEALRRRLTQEGRRRVEQRHDYRRMMSDLRDFYDQAITSHRANTRGASRILPAEAGSHKS